MALHTSTMPMPTMTLQPSTHTGDAPAHALSPTEDSCLRSALAVIVLRARLRKNPQHDKRGTSFSQPQPGASLPPLVRALTTTPTSSQGPTPPLPCCSSHLHTILGLAVTTARPLYDESTDTVFDFLLLKSMTPEYTHIHATLDGLCQHLAVQYRNLPEDSRHDFISESLKQHITGASSTRSSSPTTPTTTTFLAWCTVWLGVLQVDATRPISNPSDNGRTPPCVIGSALLTAMGRVLQDLYHDRLQVVAMDGDVVLVNLIHLVQALVWMRLLVHNNNHMSDTTPSSAHSTADENTANMHTTTSIMVRELCHALGHELLVPVPLSDMASFSSSYVFTTSHHNNKLSTASKLLLRLSLYDIVQQASRGYEHHS